MTWSLSWRVFFAFTALLAMLLFLIFLSGDILTGHWRPDFLRKTFYSSRALQKRQRFERRRQALAQKTGLRMATGFR